MCCCTSRGISENFPKRFDFRAKVGRRKWDFYVAAHENRNVSTRTVRWNGSESMISRWERVGKSEMRKVENFGRKLSFYKRNAELEILRKFE